MSEYARFIILSFGRSGSTLLAQALHSDPRIVCFGELFNASTPFVEFGIAGYGRGEADLALRKRDPTAFLRDRVFCEHDPDVRAVGFKFNYSHFWRFERIIELLTGDRDLQVVHLTRKNRLRTLVSLKLAEASGRWLEYAPEPSWSSRINIATLVKTARGPGRAIAAVRRKLASRVPETGTIGDAKSIQLDAGECREFFERMDFSERHWDELFGEHPMVQMTYEELAADVQSAAERAQIFLGLEPGPVTTALVKQNPEPLRELIFNYDELKAAFAGTAESGLFEE